MIVSEFDIALFDDWDERTTFRTGHIDKLDVTATQGNVRFQVLVAGTDWQPGGGIVVPGGIFRSFPGLGEIWQPPPTAVRFRRATVAAPAIVAFDAFLKL